MACTDGRERVTAEGLLGRDTGTTTRPGNSGTGHLAYVVYGERSSFESCSYFLNLVVRGLVYAYLTVSSLRISPALPDIANYFGILSPVLLDMTLSIFLFDSHML